MCVSLSLYVCVCDLDHKDVRLVAVNTFFFSRKSRCAASALDVAGAVKAELQAKSSYMRKVFEDRDTFAGMVSMRKYIYRICVHTVV